MTAAEELASLQADKVALAQQVLDERTVVRSLEAQIDQMMREGPKLANGRTDRLAAQVRELDARNTALDRERMRLVRRSLDWCADVEAIGAAVESVPWWRLRRTLRRTVEHVLDRVRA